MSARPRDPIQAQRRAYHQILATPGIQAALLTIDRTTRDGRRDYALLATMFNTGARVQEILDLRPSDVQLVSPATYRLFGKGRKSRAVSVWPQTAQLLVPTISERALTPASTPAALRQSSRHRVRFGVRYLLAKYCNRAAPRVPFSKESGCAPHSLGAVRPIHVLKGEIDLVTVRLAQSRGPNTTTGYAAMN